MKRQTRKLMSLLLTLVMLLSLLPTTAFAVESTTSITSINITGITAPVEGASPWLGLDEITTDTPGLEIESAFWYRDSALQNYPFEAGYTYNLTLHFDIDEGYAFSDSATVDHDLPSGTFSGKNLTIDTPWISIDYTIPAAESTPIPSVKISGVTEPVIGATPDFDITLTGDGAALYEYDEEEWEAITWAKLNPGTGEWIPLGEDTPFGAGIYCLGVALEAEDGYEFTGATKFYYNEYELPAWHDTYESNYDWWADEGVDILLYFTLEDPAAPTEITSLSATVTEPVAGASPSFEAVAGGEGYTAEVEWESEDAQLYPEEGYEFKAGEKYYLYVAFNAKEGCEFADDVTITINGDTPEDIFEHEGKIVALVTYTLPAPTPITSVKISDVTEPVIGATPDFDITLTGEGAAFDEEEGNGWWKVEPETHHWELMDEDTPFSAGLYALGVCLKSEAGYEFTDATKFYYNGDELPEYDGSYESNYELWDGGAGIYLYFTLEDPAAPTEITSLSATVTEPVAGASPSFEAVAGGEGYTVTVEWEDVDSEIYPEDEAKFEAGNQYTMVVGFSAKTGYIFADDVTITINGKTPEQTGKNGNTIWGLVTYTLPTPTPTYTVTFEANGGSVTPTSGTTDTDGKLASLPTPTRSGSYSFKGWYTAASGGTKVTASTVFTENTTIYAQWTYTGGGGGGGSYAPVSYAITVVDAKNGDVTADTKSAAKGETVTVTVDPDKGYTLETLTVTDKNGKEIELTNKGDGKYTFKMPASKVTVKATFMDDNTMLNFFVDVPADAYYYDAVLWAVKEGITNGTSATTFSPDASCTRAQMVTFLWRAAGSPEPKAAECKFTDVNMDSYYGKAVLWAVENGITNGTSDTTFSPDATCTRAQMAVFLCRMADGKPVSSTNAFTDVKADAYYADSVQWAVENAITNGTGDNKFSPDATCTRAQMVTFLYRYFVK